MKRMLTALTAIAFAGAMSLPAFAQTPNDAPNSNPSSLSASSSASTSKTENGVTTKRRGNAHEEMGATAQGGTYSEHSMNTSETKESNQDQNQNTENSPSSSTNPNENPSYPGGNNAPHGQGPNAVNGGLNSPNK